MIGVEIETLARLLARLPGLGPRSARRAVLHLLVRKDELMIPLASAIEQAAKNVRACSICGNLDTIDPCAVCADPARDGALICVVEHVADLWAIERTGAYRGLYHVLGGVLSALDGIGPEDLRMGNLATRVSEGDVREVILALSATVDGQATAHVIMDRLNGTNVPVSKLAQGVPMGGEIDYLDDGTLRTALDARRLLEP
ncbi:MAG: recombination mediator RecR [Pseudomonadota bacterium]|nr:recombination mediator RecR [Pseudomonadota bacterium]